MLYIPNNITSIILWRLFLISLGCLILVGFFYHDDAPETHPLKYSDTLKDKILGLLLYWLVVGFALFCIIGGIVIPF